MNINDAKQVMLRTHIAALQSGVRANAIEMISGPGIGKSAGARQSVQDLAAAIDEPVGLVVFMLATISSVDVRGFMMPVKRADGQPGMDTFFSTPPWFPVRANTHVCEPDGTWHKPGTWTLGPVPRIGVLFLDEFAQAEDEIKKPAAELLLHGEVGTAVLPVGWRVVAASNRMSDRSGVMRALTFITNRRMEIKVDASLPTWIDWANAQPEHLQPHYLTLSFAQKQPHLVFRDEVPAGNDPFCTPRTLCLMDADLRALRSPDDIKRNRLPLDPIAREVAAGWIGGGEAAQLFSHIRFADELPDLADIERDPAKAKVPPNRDAQMVCGYFLAHSLTAKNATKLLTYIERMSVEMQVLSVRAMVAQPERVKALVNTSAYTEWLTRNKDLLIASRS